MYKCSRIPRIAQEKIEQAVPLTAVKLGVNNRRPKSLLRSTECSHPIHIVSTAEKTAATPTFMHTLTVTVGRACVTEGSDDNNNKQYQRSVSGSAAHLISLDVAWFFFLVRYIRLEGPER